MFAQKNQLKLAKGVSEFARVRHGGKGEFWSLAKRLSNDGRRQEEKQRSIEDFYHDSDDVVVVFDVAVVVVIFSIS